MAKSKGHKAYIWGYEYFTAPDGDLYRAPLDNPLDVYGYRQGARFECTRTSVDRALDMARTAAVRAASCPPDDQCETLTGYLGE